MSLRKKINFNKVKTIVIDGRVNKLYKEGFNLVAGIEERTLKGKDKNLRGFRDYTPGYKDYKKSKGRSGKVDLTMKGHMLAAMTFKKIRNGIRFTFNSSTELKKAAGNQKKRPFFGLDRVQIKKLINRMSKL